MSNVSTINLKDRLYEKLPNAYRSEDSYISPNPYPLKRFLQVLGEGFNFIEDKITDFTNMFDAESTPTVLLDYISSMLGYKFPAELTDDEKIRLIIALPNIIKSKGTAISFKYLASIIYNSDAEVTYINIPTTLICSNDSRIRSTFNLTLNGYRSLLVTVTTEWGNSAEDLQAKFIKLAEFIRPINYTVNFAYLNYFNDSYIPNYSNDSYELSTVKDPYHTDTLIRITDDVTSDKSLETTIYSRYNVLSYDSPSILGSKTNLLGSKFILTTTPMY